MTNTLKWLALFVALLLAPAACSYLFPPDPVGPSPSAGGVAATGGESAVGGVARGGTSTQTGGSSSEGGSVATGGTTAASTTAAIVWPECSKSASKLAPGEIEQYRRTLMPRRVQIVKRPKASYQLLALPSVLWAPLAPTLNQGNLGSCTGNGGLQARLSEPWTWSGTLDPLELEALAVDIYSGATKIDPFDGYYPPDDTGSNGESVMRVMRSRGLISSWVSVHTFDGLQRQLQKGPCIMGSNWYSSMYSPNNCGQLEIAGTVDGGHETAAKAVDYSTKRILFLNSWGDRWGARRLGQGGYFWLTFGAVQRLINEGAEFECPVVSSANDNALAWPDAA